MSSDTRTTPTPRPWKYQTGPRLNGSYHVITDPYGNELFEATVLSDEQADADAAHIVRCVNSHDALVEALREALQIVSYDRNLRLAGVGVVVGLPISTYNDALAKIGAALSGLKKPDTTK